MKNLRFGQIASKICSLTLQQHRVRVNESVRLKRRQVGRRQLFELLENRALLAAWVAQGPGPTVSAQVAIPPNNPINGAIQSIAPHPTNADIVFAGTVNGGVWKTTNATTANTWTPLTDTLPSQSIGAIEFDRLDPTFNTLLVGTGRWSNYAGIGDDQGKLYHTTNGGTSWTVFSPGVLNDQKISGVAARGNIWLVTSTGGGVYRSIDGGANWANINNINGLGIGGTQELAADPSNPSRFYVSMNGAGGQLFRTDDVGATWTDVTATVTGVGTASRVRIAVNASAGVVYVAIGAGGAGGATNVWRSADQGGAWTLLDQVFVHNGGQQNPNTSLAADPSNANLVYVGGDRIDSSPFTGLSFRGNATAVAGSQWSILVNAGASNTAPHADTRDMAFRADGTLLESDDGGMYRNTNPSGTGSWVAAAGNIQAVEAHNVAYNSLNNTIVIGTQDNGTHLQPTSGNTQWTLINGGDGADVIVDSITLAAANQSIVYLSSQNLGGFRRVVYDNNNNFISNTNLAAITSPNFTTPLELNTINPQRILIGGSNALFESLDQGTTNTNIGGLGQPGFAQNAMVYGGSLGGTPNPDLIYVGANSSVFKRTTAGGPITATTALPPGVSKINDVAIIPSNYNTVFATDDNQVFMSSNGGTTWSDITGNLGTISSLNEIKTAVYVPGPAPYLAVGTRSGVFASLATSYGTWVKLETALPDVLVFDMVYDATDDVLVASTLGRGVWTMSKASTEFASLPLTQSFSNPALITINDLSSATPYPSQITVANLANPITDINVSLTGLTHSYLGDVDILLVGPHGQSVILVSDVGDQTNAKGLNFVIDDEAAGLVPTTNNISSGTYKPTNYFTSDGFGFDNFSPQAPAGPYGSALSAFDLTDANGIWKLFVMDDAAGDDGRILGGWSLSITTEGVSTVTLSAGLSGFSESDSGTTVVATLSDVYPFDVTVDLGISGTAINGVDYTLSGINQIVIPAGQTSASVDIQPIDDTFFDPNETVIIDIVGVTNGLESTTQQVTMTITDNDVAPTVVLAVNNANIVEAAGKAVFTALLSTASGLPVTINLGFTGTATAVSDYSKTSASIVIPAGQTSGSITVTALQDALDEVNETVIVDITNVIGGTEATPQQATTTITDDDLPPTVSLAVNNANFAEALGTAVFTATLSAASGLPVTVSLGYAGTATATADYTTTGTSIVIPAGQTTGRVTITAAVDTLDELNETVIVDIIGVTNGTANGIQKATATITDDDAAPIVTLTRSRDTIIEAAGSSIYTATLSAASGLPVTVVFGFAGTAIALTDYTSTATQVIIPAGNTTGAITVTASQDALDELNESIVVEISSVTNGTESGVQTATTIITDDDAAPTVTLTRNNASVVEAAGTSVFTATLSAVSGLPVTVALGFTGSATATSDYTRSASQIVIPAGNGTGTITITAVQDALDEVDETVVVDITGVINGFENNIQQSLTSITDDDAAPTVSLSRNNSLIAEAGGIVVFSAILSAASSLPVTVDLGFTGTAAFTSDYTRTGTRIIIAPGATSGSITVTATQDSIDEANETILVDITGVISGTELQIQQASSVIVDDDAAPNVSLSHDKASIAEAAGTVAFSAFLSVASGLPVTVDLGFTGTATFTSDYTRTGTRIIIAPGARSGSITVTAAQDSIDEANETILVDILGVINGVELGTQQSSTLIADDDIAPAVTLTRNNVNIAEAAGASIFTATLSTASGLPVTVALGFTGSATSPADYTRTNTQVVIPAGSTSGTITVNAVQDVIDEPNETVIVDVIGVTNGVENGVQQQTTTITDDDVAPTVTLSRNIAAITEASGISIFTATLSAISGQAVTVVLGFSGTSTSITDYASTASQIVIPAGSTTGTITVIAVQDTLDEADETIVVDIISVINGTESGVQQATATITDDDLAPTVTLTGNNATILEASGTSVYTATLSAVSGRAVTVSLGFSGTATTITDYTTTASQIVIPAGSTSGAITLTAVPDSLDELNETVNVDISSVTNGTEENVQRATTTITDDDAAPLVSLSRNNASIAEASGVVVFSALLSAASSFAVTVDLGFTGTATLTSDYTRTGTRIVIAPGLKTGSVTVTAVQDSLDEANETILVDILSVTNGTKSGIQATSLIVDDDPSPSSPAIAPQSLASPPVESQQFSRPASVQPEPFNAAINPTLASIALRSQTDSSASSTNTLAIDALMSEYGTEDKAEENVALQLLSMPQ